MSRSGYSDDYGDDYPNQLGHDGLHRGVTLTPPLTRRQREALDFIIEFIATHGYAPTFEDLGRGLGITSTATVFKHLDNLRRKGYIRRRYNRTRAIELVEQDRTLETHLAGVIAARDELRRLLRHAVDQVTVEFIPNDRALWAEDDAPIYRCPYCQRSLVATYHGVTRFECRPDGHYLYRLSADASKALTG